mmetsp:Transcript_11654/g.37105  ORF Transcript_11654/g.37105 Transcript_11654/m.37105 type:complete len:98 (+) Transcript_11654:23-316(+)
MRGVSQAMLSDKTCANTLLRPCAIVACLSICRGCPILRRMVGNQYGVTVLCRLAMLIFSFDFEKLDTLVLYYLDKLLKAAPAVRLVLWIPRQAQRLK